MKEFTRPSYAVIDCAIKNPAIPCYNRLVQMTNIPFTYHTPPSLGIKSLLDLENFKAIIVFGSFSNVADDLPWQNDLSRFLKEKILNGIPTLGICFGHQLIAHSFGAKIEDVQSEKGFHGIREFEILKSKWNFCQRDKHSCVVSHGQELKNLPKDFIHLASSKQCEFEMICHEHLPYLGIQAHPEATMSFVKNNIEDGLTTDEFELHQKRGDRIINSFLNIAERF